MWFQKNLCIKCMSRQLEQKFQTSFRPLHSMVRKLRMKSRSSVGIRESSDLVQAELESRNQPTVTILIIKFPNSPKVTRGSTQIKILGWGKSTISPCSYSFRYLIEVILFLFFFYICMFLAYINCFIVTFPT